MNAPPPSDPYFDAPRSTFDPYKAPTAPLGMPQPDRFRMGMRQQLASRLSRLGAILVDGLVALPAGAVLMVGAALVDDGPRRNQAQNIAGVLIILLGVSLVLAINIYQWYMISKTGQSIGKKSLGIRIVHYDTGQVPGFVHGVLLRLWVPGMIAAIPCVGPFFALIDPLMIFGEERRCLHDYLATTAVVEARSDLVEYLP